MATKPEGDEKKTKKDDMIIKGHIKIIEGLRHAKTTRDDQSPKSSSSPSSSSSSSYMMKVKMGNCELSFSILFYIIIYKFITSRFQIIMFAIYHQVNYWVCYYPLIFIQRNGIFYLYHFQFFS